MVDLLPIADALVLASPEGTIRVWMPAKGLLVSQVEGALTPRAGEALAAAVRKISVDGTHEYTSYNDWEKMTNYETETRVLLTDSARAGHARQIHILIGSNVVSFGVQVADAILGNIHIYEDRAIFESALRSAIEHAGR